jgi:hypothetical protein
MSYLEYKDESASNKTETFNKRTYQRNVPSQILQPNIDGRPIPTKYYKMPIVDSRKSSRVVLNQYPTFNNEEIFNPGNDLGPWSGFSSNVNKESELRNQIYANQHSSQSIYIPSSKSDLYQLHWKEKKTIQQPFSLLFQNEKYNQFNPNPDKNLVGFALFNNATRQQLKDIRL